MSARWSRAYGVAWVFLIVAYLAGIGSNRAEGQWYPGGFWGVPIPYTPPSVDFLNRQALNQASAAQPNSILQNISGRPNSAASRSRDPSFFERYDAETRLALEDRVARRPSRPIPTATATPPATAQPTAPAVPIAPVVPIASFFTDSKVLLWPSDAPVEGDLGPKRAISDQSSLAVLQETRRQGIAQVATIAEARKKLLDYGRPALAAIRARSTPRVADTFNLFLMSLYESLRQAAIPPGAT